MARFCSEIIIFLRPKAKTMAILDYMEDKTGKETNAGDGRGGRDVRGHGRGDFCRLCGQKNGRYDY